MHWYSFLAIYFLFWVLSGLLMLPFGVQTHDEAGIPKIKGQADSAPAQFSPGRVCLRATLLSLVLMVMFALNYEYGWVTRETLDFTDGGARFYSGGKM